MRPHPRLLLPLAASLAAAWSLWPATASAEPAEGPAEPSEPSEAAAPTLPLPPTQIDFLQWGAAFAAEGKARAGNVCPSDASRPCILGSGGGMALRFGQRSHHGWYMGGAYEFSKQNAANLLRLPILQQLRFEARDYLSKGTRLAPYIGGAVGVAGYGSEWKLDTGGPLASLTLGLEFESSREVYVGVAWAYRIARLQGWTDGAGQVRPSAFAQFAAIEITLETRSAFARW